MRLEGLSRRAGTASVWAHHTGGQAASGTRLARATLHFKCNEPLAVPEVLQKPANLGMFHDLISSFLDQQVYVWRGQREARDD